MTQQPQYAFEVSETIKRAAAWVRLEDQASWYDANSVKNQKWSNRLKLIQTAFALALPILNFLPIDVLRGQQHLPAHLLRC